MASGGRGYLPPKYTKGSPISFGLRTAYHNGLIVIMASWREWSVIYPKKRIKGSPISFGLRISWREVVRYYPKNVSYTAQSLLD